MDLAGSTPAKDRRPAEGAPLLKIDGWESAVGVGGRPVGGPLVFGATHSRDLKPIPGAVAGPYASCSNPESEAPTVPRWLIMRSFPPPA